MNPVKIEVSTPMIDGNGRETVLTLSSDYDADYLRLLTIRRDLLEKCEKNGWKARNPSKTVVTPPTQESQATAELSKSTNQQTDDSPICKHEIPAKLIRSTYKSGIRAGENYSAWACAKDKKDSCGFFEFTKEFIPPKHLPPRDIAAENARDEQKYQTGEQEVPF